MRQILPFININGKLINQKSARISILNQGFIYGYGIFTTIKVRDRCPLFFDRHLNRLQTSAKQLNKPPTFDFRLSTFDLSKAVHAAITKNKLINGGIRITITPATVCIHAFCFNCHSERRSPETTEAEESHTTSLQFKNRSLHSFRSVGMTKQNNVCANQNLHHCNRVAVITTPDTRDSYKIHKLTYRIPHLLAQQQAQAKGARDALFTQNGKLIESTTANIISYINKDTIITPPILGKGLNGITRQILIENLPIKEKAIPSDTTDPIILVNSLSLQIVESIDGRKLKQNSEFVNLIRQTLDKTEKTYITNNNF